ncbi:hypothetical protein J6590_066671 [Homalodisca vitripennis]|nr:hypothetical protein J6590_066671 [Homalodisca vitripennis]
MPGPIDTLPSIAQPQVFMSVLILNGHILTIYCLIMAYLRLTVPLVISARFYNSCGTMANPAVKVVPLK